MAPGSLLEYDPDAATPATGPVQFFGYDNSYFHAVLFPAVFTAYDPAIPLPTSLIVNEFYPLAGPKLSTRPPHAIRRPHPPAPMTPVPLGYFRTARPALRPVARHERAVRPGGAPLGGGAAGAACRRRRGGGVGRAGDAGGQCRSGRPARAGRWAGRGRDRPGAAAGHPDRADRRTGVRC